MDYLKLRKEFAPDLSHDLQDGKRNTSTPTPTASKFESGQASTSALTSTSRTYGSSLTETKVSEYSSSSFSSSFGKSTGAISKRLPVAQEQSDFRSKFGQKKDEYASVDKSTKSGNFTVASKVKEAADYASEYSVASKVKSSATDYASSRAVERYKTRTSDSEDDFKSRG